ncbi:hypothetical protein JTB14_031319 [Gonioctena quinquepunctata]|nr:hypothetical protein JTB14_031319 [Gonioctena quinquepunctata]
MSILISIGQLKEYFHAIRQFLPQKPTLSTTQKVVVVSVTTTVVVFGALSKYLRRKKKVIDPSKLRDSSQIRRTVFNTSLKKSRASGVRSPNGEMGSVASSGRRSATYSDKYNRQGSIVSGKASIASGSLVSSGLPIPEGLETNTLTPQQLGVMGYNVYKQSVSCFNVCNSTYKTGVLLVAYVRGVFHN